MALGDAGGCEEDEGCEDPVKQKATISAVERCRYVPLEFSVVLVPNTAFCSSSSSFTRFLESALFFVCFFGKDDMVREPCDVLQRENNSE